MISSTVQYPTVCREMPDTTATDAEGAPASRLLATSPIVTLELQPDCHDKRIEALHRERDLVRSWLERSGRVVGGTQTGRIGAGRVVNDSKRPPRRCCVCRCLANTSA